MVPHENHKLYASWAVVAKGPHDLGGRAYREVCPSLITTYLRVLRVPHVGALFILGLLASLPLGMAGLGLLLNTENRTGSIAIAGLVSGAFGLGNAVGIALQGRLMDRLGHARVLLPASVISCAALLAAAFLSSQLPLLMVTAVAGMFYPATISSVRVLSAALIGGR